MNKLTALVLAAALSSTMLVSCDKQKELIAPTNEISNEKKATNTTENPYTVVFAGRTVANGNTTFSYSVERTGPAQGNGLSHMVFSLGNCVSFESIVGGAIDGLAYETLSDLEGSGTGCNVGASFVKFDNLPGDLSSGAHIFSITVSGIIGGEGAQMGTLWVKAGNGCFAVPNMVIPGGCPGGEGCSMSQGYYFSSPVGVASWYGGSVTVAGFNYSHAEAQAIADVPNGGGILNVKKAFMQIATIKLSAATVAPGASVYGFINIAEPILATYGKLDPNNLPENSAANTAAGIAGGAIGAWVDANHCAE